MKMLRWQHAHSFRYHWCQGCNHLHPIPDEGWVESGTAEEPSFTPSFLQYENHRHGRCHYFITQGKLVYQNDCSHSLRGEHPMMDIPAAEVEKLEA